MIDLKSKVNETFFADAAAPPVHVINRGVLIEGLGCVLAGIWVSLMKIYVVHYLTKFINLKGKWKWNQHFWRKCWSNRCH